MLKLNKSISSTLGASNPWWKGEYNVKDYDFYSLFKETLQVK